jgi:hypothetical protein
MAETFDAAIYTNCAPGEGLDGIAGNQWQSRTPGMTRDLLALAERHLLYEPPEVLMAEHRPVPEFPPSLAHLREEGVFATASGCYRGREAVGRREGNHLTHVVLTRDPALYGATRPAQLAGASFWHREPRPTLELEPPPADWEPGPVGATTAAEAVRAHPEGRSMLAALVTVLGGPDVAERRRVVLSTEDAMVAVRWLAAATLLMPQHRALTVTFKVFAMRPAQSSLRVVAVHPRWSDFTGSVDRDLGYAIFDLDRHRWSTVAADPEAERWAELFCTDDPEAVAEAVDLADTTELRGSEARALAMAATLGRPPAQPDIPALLRWLRYGPAAARETYGAPVLRAVAARADATILTQLEDIARTAGYPGQVDGIRLALLRDDLARAAAGSTGATPPRRASGEIGPEAYQMILDALRSQRGRAFAATLAVAARWGATVGLAAIPEATDAFVTAWSNDPDAPYDPTGWRTEPPMIERLEEELRRRAKGDAKTTVVAATWWRRLRPEPFAADPSDPFGMELLRQAMRHADTADRQRLVRLNLESAVDGYRISDDAGGLRLVADALWRADLPPPTTAELRIFAELVPAGVPGRADMHDGLAKRIETAGRPSSPPPVAGPPRYEGDEATLKAVLSGPFDARNPSLDWLRRQPGPLLVAHSTELVDRMCAVEDLRVLDGLVRTLPGQITEQFIRRLPREEWVWSPARVAVIQYLVLRSPPNSALYALAYGRFYDSLGRWIQSHSAAEVDEVTGHVAGLGETAVQWWRQVVERFVPQRRRGLWSRFTGRKK